jgi:beta-glucanase (GH16 family)
MKHDLRRSILRHGQHALLALILVSPTVCHAAWQLVWSDEFTQADGTSPDPTKWTFDVGGGGYGNNESEYYTSRTNNARIQGNQLVIEAKAENFGGRNYTSARMLTRGKWSWAYGRIEASIKIPRGQGIWPAFWMLGTNIDAGVNWPNCGEIDIMENIGKTNNNEQARVYGTIHGPQSGGDYNGGAGVGGSYTLPGGVALGDDYHIYAVEWTTNQIKWYMDNQQYFTATPASLPSGGTWPFTQPEYILLNVAVGGNWPGYPSNYTVFPQQMLVDYVRVYSYVATIPSAPTGLTASPASAQVYLNWDDSTSGASGYIVKRATSSGGPYVTLGSSDTSSYTDSTAANCLTYYYVVTATNSLGASTNSSETPAALGAFALAVKSGGSTANQFVADTGFVTGGTIGAIATASIDTSGLVAPAPEAVYQSERYGNFTYTFTGLTTGVNYKVRLHEAETYWTAAGQRRFNVTINGTQVLTNFDIIAVAGAPNKATIQEFNVPASSGQIVIQFTTVTDNARSGGIEILLAQPAAPAGLTATPGDSQVALKWNALAGASYNVKRAPASGGLFTPVFSGLTITNCTDSGLTNGLTYFYVVSSTVSGCESTNSVSVSATPVCSPPAAPVAGNNGPIWTGMTLNLTASTVPGASYNWSGPNGFNSTNQNPSITNASASAAGLFSVTAATGGCTSAPATTMVTVNPPARVTIQPLGKNVILSWPTGTLQSATNMTGPWGDISGTPPRTNLAIAPQEFYRAKLQE